MGQSDKCPITYGLIDNGDKLGFYSEMRRNTVSFKQMKDMIHFTYKTSPASV